MQKLTETALKKLKPGMKNYFVCDGNGLNISVAPNGAKYWIVRYSHNKKESRTSLGKYPDISLVEAREQAMEIKKQIRLGTFKKEDENNSQLFGDIVNEWLNKKIKPALSPLYVEKTILRLNKYVIPNLGNVPIDKVTSRLVLEVCRKIEASGIIDTSHRVRQLIGQAFRYAIAAGYAENDPTVALSNALQAKSKRHRACFTEQKKIADFMKSINEYSGRKLIKAALLFSALTFCRPGEIRHAEWDEVDLARCEWKIPAAKMKMKRIHIVPLSTQAASVLSGVKKITGSGKYIFSGDKSPMKNTPMSESAVRLAIRSMGYPPEEMSAHGFRGMASTMLSEQGWPPEVIERQLAHAEKNAVRAAYCHAEYLAERRKMMQSWGDFLYNSLKDGG